MHLSVERFSTQIFKGDADEALAWLLQRSPNILLIPGTSSLEHLRDLKAAMLELPPEIIANLDSIG